MSDETKLPDFITEDDGFMTITLRSKATINGEKVETLRMREPTVDDINVMQKMKGDDAGKEVKIISNLCEITPSEVSALTLRNFGRVQEAFKLFTA